MGIKNFYKFIQKYSPNCYERKKIGDYSGKTLGIDGNFLLYQLLNNNFTELFYKFKNKLTIELLNEIETNYEYYYIQLLDIIKISITCNIKLIFVFDGKSPEIKKDTVTERKAKRESASNELKEFNNELKEFNNELKEFNNELKECNNELKEVDDKNEEINKISITNTQEAIEKKKKLILNSINLNNKLLKETREFLKMAGIVCLDSLNEADSQLAYLSKNNLIDGIISNDYDMLTFGGKKLLINFFGMINTNNKPVYEVDLKKLLKSLRISYDCFIELCILMGTDYSDKPNYRFEQIYTYLLQYYNYSNLVNNIDLILPKNFNMFRIKKYFYDCYANCYNKDNFNNCDYNINYIKDFLLSKKNYVIDDKFINNNILFLEKFKR